MKSRIKTSAAVALLFLNSLPIEDNI